MGALSGKVVLVTGGGNGIGRDCALIAAQEGAKVVVNDLGGSLKGEDEGSAGPAESVAQEIRAAGGEAVSNSDSVTDLDAVYGMVEQAKKEFGGLHAVINPAGILRDVMFHKMTEAEWDSVIAVHMRGSFNVARATIELFREQNDGAYMFFTSTSGLLGNIGQANYGAAKMALVGLMQTLAIEGEKYGVRVNCLAPTAATGMTQGVLSEASLERLDPSFVSPGLLALVAEDAPTRTILCAGAGHFATANVTLTEGRYVGGGRDAGEQVIRQWDGITQRAGEIVPAYGFIQAERELASAGLIETVAAGRG